MPDYAVFPEQHQALIFQILQESGRIIYPELANRLGTSEHIIHHDLHELSKDGVCEKVYGGAIITLPESEDIDMCKSINIAKKSNTVQRYARLIKSGSCTFVDTSSTNLAVAEVLPVELALTVMTDSPEIVVVLLKGPLFEVIVLGSVVRRSSGGYVGASTIVQVQDILFDRGFIGGCTMSPESGLTGFDYADCEFKRAVVKQCSETIIALTAEEIPAVARHVVVESSGAGVAIAEDSISREYATVFQAHGIQIYAVQSRWAH